MQIKYISEKSTKDIFISILNHTISINLSLVAMLLTTQGFAASLATERGYTAMGGELIVIILMGISVYFLLIGWFKN